MSDWNDTRAAVIALHDGGHSVATIATALHISASHVYGILQTERPNRARKARGRTSNVPARIAKLAGNGWKAAQIAESMGISRAYVYRHLPALGAVAALRRLGLRITIRRV